MEKADLLNIARLNKTVFTFKEILLASGETHPSLLRRRISYYLKQGELYPIRRGIYARDANYDKLELATKIFTPAYLSFETVLSRAGVIFQYYGQIFVASYLTREIVVDGQTYSYRKIKNAILTHHHGIEINERYSVATPERAFLDVVYLNQDYHFDNLSPLDWKTIFELLPIYGDNKRMSRRVKQYHETFSSNE